MSVENVEPSGVFREIDIDRDWRALEVLNRGGARARRKVVDTIISDPNVYTPPVLCALSRELFSQEKTFFGTDRRDEAAFWFYVAQLRARYDANLCMDETAAEGAGILTLQYGPEINRYMFQDLGKLESTVKRVVDFVRSHDETYDHRWINLHGMWAITSGMKNEPETRELSRPRSEWADIKKNTVDEYYQGFVDAIRGLSGNG